LMSATLPDSLIEQYAICELCDCPTEVLFREEIKGSDYLICMECRESNADQIRDAAAEDMAGADAAEAAQEEL